MGSQTRPSAKGTLVLGAIVLIMVAIAHQSLRSSRARAQEQARVAAEEAG